MGGSSMKSYTDAFFKTEPEDTLETKVNLMIETMEGLANRLQRIEAKVADVHTDLILVKSKILLDKKIPFKNGPEFTSSFAYSDNRREAHATYTPPRFGGGDDDDRSIIVIVKGFDTLIPEYHMKNVLRQYFRSCGEIISVVVPTDQGTGVLIGCAYIHLKEGVEKALKLNGSYFLGRKLVVEKVTPTRDDGYRFGPSGREGHWPYPYRCNGLGYCRHC